MKRVQWKNLALGTVAFCLFVLAGAACSGGDSGAEPAKGEMPERREASDEQKMTRSEAAGRR